MRNYFINPFLTHCIITLVSFCLIMHNFAYFAWASDYDYHTLSPRSPFSDAVESRTQEVGEILLKEIEKTKPGPINRFKDFLIDFGMCAAGWKVKLLEFLDVAPVLATSWQVFTQLLDIFQSNRWLQFLIIVSAIPFFPLYPLYRRIILFSVEFVAIRFIASDDYNKLTRRVKELEAEGAGATIDVLGEGIRTKKQVTETVAAYKMLLAKLKSAGIDSPNVSVKLTGLSSNFDELNQEGQREAIDNLKEILASVIRVKGFVYIDMEEYKLKDLTLRIFKEILEDPEFRDTNNLGIVIQAYLKDSKDDVRKLMQWAREQNRTTYIRLVKGAYWDQENIWAIQEDRDYIPVFSEKEETDRNFEEISQMIMEDIAQAQSDARKPLIMPAFGSHNARSIAKVISLIENLQIDEEYKNQIEFQMLFGMGERLRVAVSKMGYKVRVYTPFGRLIPGMAYLVRRILENTANEGFISQSKGRLTPEKIKRLLRNPLDILKDKRRMSLKPREPNRNKDSTRDFTNEPLIEWHIRENQTKMEDALKEVSSGFETGPKKIPIVINGKEIYLDDNAYFPSGNVALVPKSTREIADRAMECAEDTFKEWKDTPISLRAEFLFKAAQKMRERRFTIAALIVYEVGKTWKEADADVAEAVDFLEYYALSMKDISKTEQLQPIGPGVVIAPWNFPLAILAGMTVAAVVSGNTVVMKPAEQSSAVAYELMKILNETLPSGVVNLVPGYGKHKDDNLSVGEYLVHHEKGRFVAFTGSTEVGDKIRLAAARSLPAAGQPTGQAGRQTPKRVILETGGKNAIYVDRTADLDKAVQGVIDSFIGFSGQKCSACSRVFIHQAVYSEFLIRLKEKIKTTIVGNSDNPSTQMGPVIDDDAAQKIMDMINQAHNDRWGRNNSEQWKLEYGEGLITRLKRLFLPTIFSSTSPSAYKRAFAQIEMFGPGVAVMVARNIDHAIQMINHTGYGLTSGIYTRNESQKTRFVKKVQAGVIYINRKITAAMVSMVGFGGIKQSGTGIQAGAPDYLFQFLSPEAAPYEEKTQATSFNFQSNPDYSIIKSSQEYFEIWREETTEKRLHLIAKLRSNGIQIPEDFIQAIKTTHRPHPRPLRKVVGIKNQFIYEPLGPGILIPSSDPDANMRMILIAILTGNTLIAPDTTEMRRIREILTNAGIPTEVFQLSEKIDLEWISSKEIRFVIMTQEDNNYSTRDKVRLAAAQSRYPTRVIIEEGDPSLLWRQYTPYYISRLLQAKSVLEILPPEIANTEFLSITLPDAIRMDLPTPDMADGGLLHSA